LEVGMYMEGENVTSVKFYYIYSILKQAVRNDHGRVCVLGG